ncbi:E3 ubiquitin-protein ligase RFI2 isoform X2 [Diospyros lotus]|uniref:E3 ubiquitin-protein ligase RFI2 isoform X2 n=1 Tax=Diospyros lotus TaxID=55363 RepID=UPI00225A2B7D|nr:E3 ubiquitin-protein ligase RFI2 isoform X2 [Diospyros lotus]
MGEPDDGKSTTPESYDNSVRCTICLDLVTDRGARSTAKLQCGHEFHLDCIGSTFNIKGAMQCPNCRKVEKGRWLYASGSTCSVPEFHMEHPDEHPYQLSYYEMPIGVHWCPFSGVAQAQTSFWAVESPSPIYHNLQRYNALFAQHTPVSFVAPYVAYAYVRSIPSVSSNTNENVEDLNFNHQWNGIPGQNEIFSGHTFPVTDIQQQSWGHHSHPFPINSRHVNHTDQALVPLATLRSTRDDYDAMTRSGAFVQPFFYGQGYSQPHERVQASHPIHQQPQPGNSLGMPSAMVPDARIFNGPRGFPVGMPAISQSGHNGGFFVFPAPAPSFQNPHEAENFLLSHIHAWERYQSHLAAISLGRYSVSGPLNHASGASDASNRSGNLGHRHRS